MTNKLTDKELELIYQEVEYRASYMTRKELEEIVTEKLFEFYSEEDKEYLIQINVLKKELVK
jgi:hypothetical protein